MSDDDLIRRGDAREALREVDAWTMPIAHAIRALPAVTVGVTTEDIDALAYRFWSIHPKDIPEPVGMPEGYKGGPRAWFFATEIRRILAALEPVPPAPDADAIREAWGKAYWRLRSYAVHDNDCKLNKPPRFDGPCSCGLTAALEEALALISKGATEPTEYERKVAQMKKDFPNGI